MSEFNVALSVFICEIEPFSAGRSFSACSNKLKLSSSLSSLTGSVFFSFWGTSTTFIAGLNMGWDSSCFISRNRKYICSIEVKSELEEIISSLYVRVKAHLPCCMMRILSCAVLWPALSPFVLAAAAISFASYSWAVRTKYLSFYTARW